MKQMRSRFRLITLLLVCAFFLALVLCTGSVLKEANVSISALASDVTSAIENNVPASSVSPDASPANEITPAPSGSLPVESVQPGNDSFPEQVYNTQGL